MDDANRNSVKVLLQKMKGMIITEYAKKNTDTNLPLNPSAKAPVNIAGEIVVLQTGFEVINNPTPCYLAGTTKIDFSGLADSTPVTSITDGIQTVSFDQTLEKRQVGYSWATWSTPPDSESATPAVLFNLKDTALTLTLSQPSKVFGFELEPNAFGPFNYSAQFLSDSTVLGTITRTVDGFAGARLFAASTEPITSVVITGDPSLGFAIAQIRYSVESQNCSGAPVERVIPFSCTINTPFNVLSLGTPDMLGYNQDVTCTQGTCLIPVDIPLPDNTTINCCVELDTTTYTGTMKLLLMVPALFDVDFPGPVEVTLYCGSDIDINQTCFSCKGHGACSTLDGAITVETIEAVQTVLDQVVISGTVRFNCP